MEEIEVEVNIVVILIEIVIIWIGYEVRKGWRGKIYRILVLIMLEEMFRGLIGVKVLYLN